MNTLCDILPISVDLNNLAWSVTMACYAHGTPISTVWTYVGLFLAASQVFHAAGCVINDMWDKDVDAAVRKCCSFSQVETPCDTFVLSANKHAALGFRRCLDVPGICLPYPTAGSWHLAVDAVE